MHDAGHVPDPALAPMTPMQQGMLFASLQAPADAGVYIEQVVARPALPLQMEAFTAVWQTLIDRHEALRLRFHWRGQVEARQEVCQGIVPSIQALDWGDASVAMAEERLGAFLKQDRRAGIALDSAPMHRLAVISLPDQRWWFVWTIHHAIIDGRAIATVLSEWQLLYEAFCAGAAAPTLPPTAAFTEFARAHQQPGESEGEAAFWRGALAPLDEPCALPLAAPDSPVPGISAYSTYLEAGALSRLEAFAQSQQVSVATLVHAAWAIVLGQYSGAPAVAFGVTRALKHHDGQSGTAVGLYINTLPLVVAIDHNATVSRWLAEVRAAWRAQYDYARTPLSQIERWSRLAPGLHLFDTYTVFERGTLDDLARGSAADPQRRWYSLHECTPSPLTLALYQHAQLDIHFEYDTERFSRAAIQRLSQHFVQVLVALPAHAQATVGDLPMLAPAERALLLPEAPRPPDILPVHLLIAESARQRPGAPALQSREEIITYAQLNADANRVAHALRARGLAPGALVALAVPRSSAAIIAMLGVLKAGAAYLPLDPTLPADRRAYVLRDSDAAALIDVRGEGDSGVEVGIRLALENDAEFIASQPQSDPTVDVAPDAPAYVIYTSGSTGRPKGVVVPHGALAAFVDGALQLYALQPRDRVLQFASLSFDAAAEEIFPTLVCGATLVLRTDEMIASATGFLEQCRNWRISVLDLPTAYWHVLVDALDRIEWPACIRMAIIGGEAARPEKAARWRSMVPKAVRLANTYGPTETTVAVTCAFLDEETGEGPVPIGKPFPHVAAYVLSPTGQPVPKGAPGELCIGGPQVATGYLGRDDLTAAAFVAAPWDPALRLYHTGDRVYLREDDAIMYLDRMDRQVKWRGFRIELGEIEAALEACPGVAHAAVLLREDQPGSPELCAYVAASPAADAPSEGALRQQLAQNLPSYMQPSHIVILAAMPMTTSGKVDRKALGPPPRKAVPRAPRAPQTTTETKVLAIWRAVLGSEEIGCDDDFLAIGGHSLLAVQILSRIADEFGPGLSIATFLAASTVGQLSEQLDAMPRAALAPIPRQPMALAHALTPDQQILWVFEQVFPGTPAYHIAMAYRLSGPLDMPRLQQALARVVSRHEPLRAVFAMEHGTPVMQTRAQVEVPWQVSKHPTATPDDVREWLAVQASEPIDPRTGPVLKAFLLQVAPDEHVVLLCLHHLVADGWSVGIIAREWSEAYRALMQGEEPTWPPLPLRYADYAVWIRAQRPRPGDESDRFLHEQLVPPVPRFHWPKQTRQHPSEHRQGAQYPFRIVGPVAEGLARVAQEQNTTPFSVLFTLYALALRQMTGAQDGLIGFSLAGRTRTALEPLVGYFIATLLLRVQMADGQRLDQLLRDVRDELLEAQQHQHTPYSRFREVQPEAVGGPPLMQALFLMQSINLEPLVLPGVRAQTLNVDMGKALTEITLEIYPVADGYEGWCEYQTASFDRETIARFVLLYTRLAQQLVENPYMPLDSLVSWDDCPVPETLAPPPPLYAPQSPEPLRVAREAIHADDDSPPDAVEQFLLKQFERILRVRGLGVHDNFFDHGGHSLLGILLLDRIEREFGVRLPPVRIYQAPSVRSLAQFVRDVDSAPQSRIVHKIQPLGSKPPLFFVGSTDMIPPLVPYLGVDQPLYSLNVFGLLPDTGPVPNLTIAKIAAAYIPEVLAICPDGPFRFAAYCRDTMLALELAQQLTRLGHTVDRVIMIDFFWETKPRYPKLVRHLFNLRDFGWQYAEEKFTEFKRQQYERYLRVRARLAQKRQQHDPAALSQANRNAAFISEYYDAALVYEVDPYPGHLHVILVTEWGFDRVPEWEEVARDGVTVLLLKACHHNVWHPPQDQDLAALLRAALD